MLPYLDPKCILCIDPGHEICVLLTMMLSREDLKVMHVKDIEEAVRFLINNQPALLSSKTRLLTAKSVIILSLLDKMRRQVKY